MFTLFDIENIKVVNELGHTTVYTEDGDYVWFFSPNITHDDLKNALRLANAVYAKGVNAGRLEKLAEIRAALEMPTLREGVSDE